MKISDMIKELVSLQSEHGDIPIKIFDYDGDGNGTDIRFCLLEDETGRIAQITLGDGSWADAFAE